MNATKIERKTSLLRLLGKWMAELLLVFIGAYAAFSLNTYQQHQHDSKRRDQILASLEDYVQLIAIQSQKNAEAQEKRAAEFERGLAGKVVRPEAVR